MLSLLVKYDAVEQQGRPCHPVLATSSCKWTEVNRRYKLQLLLQRGPTLFTVHIFCSFCDISVPPYNNLCEGYAYIYFYLLMIICQTVALFVCISQEGCILYILTIKATHIQLQANLFVCEEHYMIFYFMCIYEFYHNVFLLNFLIIFNLLSNIVAVDFSYTEIQNIDFIKGKYIHNS